MPSSSVLAGVPVLVTSPAAGSLPGSWTAGLLSCEPDYSQMAEAYLAAWGEVGDTNFAKFVESTGLTLKLDPALAAGAPA